MKKPKIRELWDPVVELSMNFAGAVYWRRKPTSKNLFGLVPADFLLFVAWFTAFGEKSRMLFTGPGELRHGLWKDTGS
jgi:hypothetical protein